MQISSEGLRLIIRSIATHVLPGYLPFVCVYHKKSVVRFGGNVYNDWSSNNGLNVISEGPETSVSI